MFNLHMSAFLGIFISETERHLESLYDLVNLMQQSNEWEAAALIRKHTKSMQQSALTMGFGSILAQAEKIERLTHEAEGSEFESSGIRELLLAIDQIRFALEQVVSVSRIDSTNSTAALMALVVDPPLTADHVPRSVPCAIDRNWNIEISVSRRDEIEHAQNQLILHQLREIGEILVVHPPPEADEPAILFIQLKSAQESDFILGLIELISIGRAIRIQAG